MIIGLGFRARSGKDCVADYLVKQYGFCKVSFADSLKRACKEIFHLSDEQLYGNLKEVVDSYWKVTPRFILQKVGTECMRNVYDKNIWIDSLGARMMKDQVVDYVVPDVRFVNEARAIHGWVGKLIKIERDHCGASGGIQNHASETELVSYDKWDYVIHNDSTLEDLYRKVDNLIQLMGAK